MPLARSRSILRRIHPSAGARYISLEQHNAATNRQITPSSSLEYRPCFDGFQCARLDVPMDYYRTDGQGSRVAIAITRLPAKVPISDPRYGGAIIINPGTSPFPTAVRPILTTSTAGGPGGSGVAQVLRYGRDIQTVADANALPPTADPSARYFDIIGFDPRGVNNTTPGVSCFPDRFSQTAWDLQREADGMLGSSAQAFTRNWARTVARNTGCARTLSTPASERHDALGEHMNTAPVARDMLELVERHGEWRGKRGQEAQRKRDRVHGRDAAQAIARRTQWKKGREKLLYWGRSYGTVLGATFATLYPDRVERAVLDAVVDAQRYYTGQGGVPIVDADAIFDRFAAYCDAAGATACPFHVAGGPVAIRAAYDALEDRLRNTAVPVPATAVRGPELVTWTDLKTLQRVAVYQPLAVFPLLAQYASELARGDGGALADLKSGLRSPSCPSAECLQAGPWTAECQAPGEDEASGMAVLCSDATYLQGLSERAFGERWQGLRDTSAAIGDYWAQMELDCVRWNVTPKWAVNGPVSGNTSHPILFVNNVLDPVTPLKSAEIMSERFPGSVVLRQDSEGHSTLAAPSICTTAAIRKYFQTGELPPPRTLCDGDLKPFLGAPDRLDSLEEVRRAVLRPFAL
ncbi:conserved hypothetical protein [Aspergillus terreus NIH2624]|uniref:Peptidase S33 tripeptidyl aminopeptidase-like C-terminal domain-containing protein n=1 Tax=Aspergillus terreus (strain NIH 2624 / FGSC A1156) TaxID=341663 RepID=Q0CB38_ASPTN|nr:uncharacterized protein ATEG_09096 [Aspergillus terreus NIH2624]EAU30233.1 conserved hypothetical protein [Aspergillus terreus NIH2624]